VTRIHYTKPSITDLEVEFATDAARNGWGSACYAYIERFEREFAALLGVTYAIATSSCTGALHLGLAAAGIGDGDEVIVADTNWIASVAPITYLNATPVFVDVLPDSWCIDPVAVEAAITPRTKAIIAVHLYGNLADLTALKAIADRHGLLLVEDAAEAFGSIYHGTRAGAFADFGIFSFHGTKTLTTGEGGLFVTSRADLYEKVLTLNAHGRAQGQTKQFWSDVIGYKYKMSNLQAAIGCAQLQRADELIAGKRRVFETYRRLLADLPLQMNPEPEGCVNGYWMPSIVVDKDVPFDREAVLEAFKANEIDGRVFFWPVSMLPMFEDKPGNKVSYSLYPRALNLPSYHDLTDQEMERVASVIRTAIG
jgi:perosamine synthetase